MNKNAAISELIFGSATHCWPWNTMGWVQILPWLELNLTKLKLQVFLVTWPLYIIILGEKCWNPTCMLALSLSYAGHVKLPPYTGCCIWEPETYKKVIFIVECPAQIHLTTKLGVSNVATVHSHGFVSTPLIVNKSLVNNHKKLLNKNGKYCFPSQRVYI